MAQKWLPLFEYSVKHGVSLSTLRRRIKSHSVVFKLDNGKYLILDEGETVQESEVARPITTALKMKTHQAAHPSPMPAVPAENNFVEASVLSSANRLVEELKAAYAKILQEKEEQIGILREEIVDLKMLTNVMEDQINELKQASVASAGAQTSAPAISTETFFFPEIES